jgi:hypothetical protein
MTGRRGGRRNLAAAGFSAALATTVEETLMSRSWSDQAGPGVRPGLSRPAPHPPRKRGGPPPGAPLLQRGQLISGAEAIARLDATLRMMRERQAVAQESIRSVIARRQP